MHFALIHIVGPIWFLVVVGEVPISLLTIKWGLPLLLEASLGFVFQNQQ